MPNKRCVFDTNVIVSALLFEESKPGRAFYTALDAGEILVSLPVVSELNEVLGRKKLDRYVRKEERERFLGALLLKANLVEVTERIRACRDPKDDRFLELAVSGEAGWIISGDRDLLELHPFRGIPILTPDEFLLSFSAEDELAE